MPGRPEIRRLLEMAPGLPPHEAEQLMAHVLGVERSRLHADPVTSTGDQMELLKSLAARRAAGEPLQYLIGWVPFLDARIAVGPGVLVPRPETEYLAESALEMWRAGGSPQPRVAVDVGTGSGCIAIGIALAEPGLRWIGLDISADALEWAARNVRENGLEGRIDLYNSDLFSALEAIEFQENGASMVISNPPYVAPADAPALPRDVRDHEPHAALFSGPTGLEHLERIIRESPRWLAATGLLALEIGETQMDNALACVRATGSYSSWEGRADLAGRPRMVFART